MMLSKESFKDVFAFLTYSLQPNVKGDSLIKSKSLGIEKSKSDVHAFV
jgi:hypothetical protein